MNHLNSVVPQQPRTGYSVDVLCALDECIDFYEGEQKPAMFALVDSALRMAEAGDMNITAVAHIKQALLFAQSDLEGQVDIVDSDGGPAPNNAMRLYSSVEDALARLPKERQATPCQQQQALAAPKVVPTPWKVCPGDPRYVSLPGIVKPVNAGSRGTAERIVCAVNAHHELVDALQLIAGSANVHADVLRETARAALAKVQQP